MHLDRINKLYNYLWVPNRPWGTFIFIYLFEEIYRPLITTKLIKTTPFISIARFDVLNDFPTTIFIKTIAFIVYWENFRPLSQSLRLCIRHLRICLLIVFNRAPSGTRPEIGQNSVVLLKTL